MWSGQSGTNALGNVTKQHTGLYAAGALNFPIDQFLCICCAKDPRIFEIVIREEV